MSKRDYYKIPGPNKGVDDNEIKRVYRKMTKKYHPDVNRDPEAEESFEEVNETYEVLDDLRKKATYNQLGHTDMDGTNSDGSAGNFGGLEDFGDISGSFFGGGFGGGGDRRTSNGSRKGNDRFMQTHIEFMDAVFGKAKIVTIEVDEQCDECMGSSAKSKSDIKSCPRCNGTGVVTTQQRAPFGMFQSRSACPDCNGTDRTAMNKCPRYHSKDYRHKRVELDIKIPADTQSSQQVRVPNKGEHGVNGGSNGDLYIEILVSRYKQFV